MDTVTQGALLARKPVGGIKIGKEAGEWTASNFHPYLPSENYLTLQVIHHPCFMVSVSHVFSSNLTQPVPMVISLLHSNWRFKINLTAYAVFKFRFLFARKHRLVDVVVGNNSFDKTVVVAALPGRVGTLDEVFEMLALIQLERIGSKLPIPFMLSNNDSFYSKLLDFLDDCENWGTVSKGEFASLWKVCNSNSEALAYLEDF
jgi:predicted Rossmann-fold nucleotide-binding protein